MVLEAHGEVPTSLEQWEPFLFWTLRATYLFAKTQIYFIHYAFPGADPTNRHPFRERGCMSGHERTGRDVGARWLGSRVD